MYLRASKVLPVKCWHCNHGKALTRAGGEKGPEKALSAAHCLFMAVRAPVRRVMTGHYLFVVLSLWSREGPGLSVSKQYDS